MTAGAEPRSRRRLGGSRIAAAVLAASLLFAAGPLRAEAPVALDMRTWGGRPLVDVLVDGVGPFPFILDTGATQTIMDASLARDLGLEVVGSTTMTSPVGEGEIEAELVSVGALGVESIRHAVGEIALFDLAAFLSDADGPRGVLSYRFFDGHLIELDYPGEQLRIVKGTLPPANDRDIFAYTGDIPEVPLRLTGPVLRVHLDTGSPGGFTLPTEMIGMLPLVSEPVLIGRGETINATFDIYEAPLDGAAEIGALRFERPRLRFFEGAVGHVGNEVVQGMLVVVDPLNSRVRLSRPGTDDGRVAAKPAARKRYGIRFTEIESSPLAVVGVDEGSIAEEGGVQAGDLITALNGREVAGMSFDDRVQALRGTPLEVTVRRGEASTSFVLEHD